jgi:hypothetical protein
VTLPGVGCLDAGVRARRPPAFHPESSQNRRNPESTFVSCSVITSIHCAAEGIKQVQFGTPSWHLSQFDIGSACSRRGQSRSSPGRS